MDRLVDRLISCFLVFCLLFSAFLVCGFGWRSNFGCSILLFFDPTEEKLSFFSSKCPPQIAAFLLFVK